MHISIAGNIGAGKTTLTGMLASHYQWKPHYGDVDDNPYLDNFYNDMSRWAFHLQVYFLGHRLKKLKLLQNSKENIIQDRTIYEDAYIFAANLYGMGLLDSRDYATYKSLFETMQSFIEAPRLLIYLRASIVTLLEQIHKRGRVYEKSINEDYLIHLNERYEAWIKNYNAGPLLIIDVDAINFVENPDHFHIILRRIDREIFSKKLKKTS
ncbi:deoxynucleoside kinase [Bacteroidetes bacterium endosymbiont of Geopemphigus sp.]|uniref:deoxynucleoside kinase n=1 Tax=Bacteroidetes bacterium endosymbiont of Geopemphigus sp. TaxID=2047937 RepID=UPI000CD10CC9|nr:deoxynucleoside kinase [Bacteroidetes bacterium endosymbiont of Geopemphigus sp.]